MRWNTKKPFFKLVCFRFPRSSFLHKRNIIRFCIPKFICEHAYIDHRGVNVWQCRWYVSNKLLKFHLLSLTYKIHILFEPSNRMPDSVLHSTLFVSTKIRSICSIVLYIWGDHTKGSWVNEPTPVLNTEECSHTPWAPKYSRFWLCPHNLSRIYKNINHLRTLMN